MSIESDALSGNAQQRQNFLQALRQSGAGSNNTFSTTGPNPSQSGGILNQGLVSVNPNDNGNAGGVALQGGFSQNSTGPNGVVHLGNPQNSQSSSGASSGSMGTHGAMQNAPNFGSSTPGSPGGSSPGMGPGMGGTVPLGQGNGTGNGAASYPNTGKYAPPGGSNPPGSNPPGSNPSQPLGGNTLGGSGGNAGSNAGSINMGGGNKPMPPPGQDQNAALQKLLAQLFNSNSSGQSSQQGAAQPNSGLGSYLGQYLGSQGQQQSNGTPPPPQQQPQRQGSGINPALLQMLLGNNG